MPRLDDADTGDATGPSAVTGADLRMPLLGLGAWAGAVAATVLPAGVVLLVVVVGAALTGVAGWHRGWSTESGLTLVAATAVLVCVVSATGLHEESVRTGPVAELAAEQAAVEVEAVVVGDPRLVHGRFADLVTVRLDVREVAGRGLVHRLRSPVLVLADTEWRSVRLGARVRTHGRLAPADDGDLAAILTGASPPKTLDGPDVWWRGAEAVRASIRASVAQRPADQRALVPALVDGDDAGLDPDLADDFATTGLTHLTAVSGTNLTLLVGFLLAIARGLRIGGRGQLVVAAAGVVGFVLLARTEPSVLRAAAMGTVGLLAMGSGGRQRALRSLGVAVLVLLVLSPPLAVSAGFALSVMATAGIVVLGPGWRDAMARWMPRWAAEAIAVPAAAQLACTPVVAAISGQVSLVAVAANLVVAPVVGPATVLGLAGGLLGVLPSAWGPWLGGLAGTGAAWCVGWIVAVARRGADLPLAALEWGSGAAAVTVLTVLCVVGAVVAPRLLRRPRWTVGVCALAVVVVTLRVPAAAGGLLGRLTGWPDPDWAVAMCDVGQGDAIAVRAGPTSAVVLDAGPDPDAVRRCLDTLGIDTVPLVVLTHFHADHVDGLPGVLEGRAVGAIWTTTMLDPPQQVSSVEQEARTAAVPIGAAPHDGVHRIGAVALQVVWPDPAPVTTGPGDGSTANNESVVLVIEVAGIRVLATGDLEPPGQAALAQEVPGLEVDVLKVPHHGSRYQDPEWIESLGADLALVSVGADNDYGHPAPETLAVLERTGAQVARTDTDGTVLVVPGPQGPEALTR